jgi:hypothetical protein
LILVLLRVTLERNQAAVVVLPARASKGRLFLLKYQAMGMAKVANSDTSVVYYRRVVNCQNGPALSSTNRNLRRRIV